MATNNSLESEKNYSATAENNELENGGFNLRMLLAIVLGNWFWILLSVILFGAAGWYYLKITPNTYQRSALVVIKEDSPQRGKDLNAMFANLGQNPDQSNVNNEMAAIQAPSNVLETVKRLNLDMNYTMEGRWHKNILYGRSLPANVRMMGLGDHESAAMQMELQPNGVVKLSNFMRNGKPVGSPEVTVTGRTSTIIGTPVGNVLVTPTQYYGSFVTHTKDPILVTRTDLYTKTEGVQRNLSVELTDKMSTLVRISYKDKEPYRADDIINTLITVYKESWVRDKNMLTIATTKFINDRLAIIERELSGIDSDISSYKSSNLLPSVQAASQMSMQQSQESQKQVLALNTQRSMAQYVKGMLTRGAKSRKLLPTNAGLESTGIEQQIAEYNTLLLQRNSLIANSSERNPIVSDYDEQLAQIRKVILEGIDNLCSTIDLQLSHAQQNENQATAKIASSPKQEKYLTSVGRQQQVKEQLYLFLLQKREENEMNQAFTAYNIRIITAPFGNAYPISPNHRNILLIALALGLMLPIGLFYLRESMNTTVRGRKDIEGLTIPFIGEIPYTGKRKWWQRRNKRRDKLQIDVQEGKRNVMNEAFRVLRTKLEFLISEDRKDNVMIMTSFNSGSGKTYLSANIAMSLAIKQKKVLIIDCDIRKAMASALVGSPQVGLTHYLTGKETDLHELIHTYKGNENLSILPVGIVPPNPTELLGNGRLKDLLEEVRSQYDYVLLDCPPIEVVADTEIISSYVDRTIFIVRAGLLDRSLLKELQRLYNAGKYRNMALILNGTETRVGYHRYGYGYDYGYGYGYSYGYGETDDDKKKHKSKKK